MRKEGVHWANGSWPRCSSPRPLECKVSEAPDIYLCSVPSQTKRTAEPRTPRDIRVSEKPWTFGKENMAREHLVFSPFHPKIKRNNFN